MLNSTRDTLPRLARNMSDEATSVSNAVILL